MKRNLESLGGFDNLPAAELGEALEYDWRIRDKWHKSDVATPLNSRTLREPNGTLYLHAALDHVERIVDGAKNSDTMRDIVRLQVEIAAQSALLARVEENEQKTIPVDSNALSAELFEKALLGVATADELIALLGSEPYLESLELAKQTLPCAWDTAMEMGESIDMALRSAGFRMRESDRTQNIRYGLTRVDDTVLPSAVTIVRKADLGTLTYGSGDTLMAVQRDSLVIDLEHQDTAKVRLELQAYLKTADAKQQLRGNHKAPYEGETLTEFVDAQYATQIALRSPAVVPVVRSYYAYRTDVGRP